MLEHREVADVDDVAQVARVGRGLRVRLGPALVARPACELRRAPVPPSASVLHGTSGGGKNSVLAINWTRICAISDTANHNVARGYAAVMGESATASRLLDVMEHDILPMTARGVAEGNKMFGAALLRKSDLSVVIAGTNAETDNPLLHGEISTLNQFYELADRPSTRDLTFLSTHEPCPLCLSAITWAGFDSFYYFFSYEDSRDAFDIPHDLQDSRRRSSALKAAHTGAATRSGPPLDTRDWSRPRRSRRATTLQEQGAANPRSATPTCPSEYQKSKGDNDIPLS